jgi:hypothetical protein
MPSTYEPLATYTANGSETVITFSSISSSYIDLKFIASYNTSSNSAARLRFNNDTGANYVYRYIYAMGDNNWNNTANTGSLLPTAYNSSMTSTYPAFLEADILSYATGGLNNPQILMKMSFKGTSQNEIDIANATWQSSATGINTISFSVGSGTFTAGGLFSLYGIGA